MNNDYPFHTSKQSDRYYGVDPYNTADGTSVKATGTRKGILIRPTMQGVDIYAQMAQRMFGTLRGSRSPLADKRPISPTGDRS